MSYIDAHCHLADLRIYPQVHKIISRSRQQDIRFFLQAGVDPEDWQRQELLHEQYPEIWPCYGLHPYFVSERSEAECELALEILAKKIPQAYALGETGLDFRPQIMKDSQALQVEMFVKQLELAQVAAKPVVLHLVRAFDKAMQIFDLYGLPGRGGMVHAFNGSSAEAEAYLHKGLYLSVGGAAARADNQRLHQAIRLIPLERLLLESDSPDQPPPGIEPGSNEPTSLWKVAESIGKIKGKTATEILDKTSQNLRQLLSL